MENIERINPPGLFDSRSTGFSQVSVKELGNHKLISVSGQVAWNENRSTDVPDDLHQQVLKSLENLKTALESAGAALSDVMSLRLYIRADQIENHTAITDALIATFGEDLPCTTWIGVPTLASGDFLIEIESDPVVVENNH